MLYTTASKHLKNYIIDPIYTTQKIITVPLNILSNVCSILEKLTMLKLNCFVVTLVNYYI